jgi:hypothetical protein
VRNGLDGGVEIVNGIGRRQRGGCHYDLLLMVAEPDESATLPWQDLACTRNENLPKKVHSANLRTEPGRGRIAANAGFGLSTLRGVSRIEKTRKAKRPPTRSAFPRFRCSSIVFFYRGLQSRSGRMGSGHALGLQERS